MLFVDVSSYLTVKLNMLPGKISVKLNSSIDCGSACTGKITCPGQLSGMKWPMSVLLNPHILQNRVAASIMLVGNSLTSVFITP